MLRKSKKDLIELAKYYHDNNLQLAKTEGAMFLALILNQNQMNNWTLSEFKRWGYLLHPYYLTDEIFSEFGGIA